MCATHIFLDCSSGHQYHSWSYYRDNFGIYDDDPEIITLNKADFGEKTCLSLGSDSENFRKRDYTREYIIKHSI